MNDWDEDKGKDVRDMSLGRVLVSGSLFSIVSCINMQKKLGGANPGGTIMCVRKDKYL